jgi:hypothetical protein
MTQENEHIRTLVGRATESLNTGAMSQRFWLKSTIVGTPRSGNFSSVFRARLRQLIEPWRTKGNWREGLAGDQAFGWVTNKPSRVACARYSFRDSSGSFATLAAIRPPLGQRHLCAHFA